MHLQSVTTALADAFHQVRDQSVRLCAGLETEDFVVQPMVDASPPKWHLGHTTWFWETFVLIPNVPDYQVFNNQFNYVFNSYYETVGRRTLRTMRGNLSRPTVAEVYRYRDYVDEQMNRFLTENELATELESLLVLGLEHEKQHQELLITDIKYTLGHNPLFPALDIPVSEHESEQPGTSITIHEGVYTIGYQGSGFSFDNELGVHKVYLNETTLAGNLVTNAEYVAFIEAGGYSQFQHWLSDGWAWVNATKAEAPLYWHKLDGRWHNYTFAGLEPIDPDAPVCHVNFYEADAYARWRGTRLPTEFEWETAALRGNLNWGKRWEWTSSAYLPYPGFKTVPGAVGEYNGKFMSGQMVLRGASVATPPNSSRPTYRNFFQPDKQWQYTGIRLVNA
ncbi:ergothioneine biosynthesis protein EgtB [Fibrella aquatica]|uniref:ergothioneine biosynthesis protein EgtB n=1 Tax=Fibrella aquatica TaxID=3242487 RepID=UPI0035224D53